MSATTILIILPLLAAIVATIAKTTRPGRPFPRNLTRVGWTLLLIAAISAGLNYWLGRERDKANSVREFHALRELEIAIYRLMSPVVVESDPPEIDDRFRVAAGYGEAGVFKALCDTDLSKKVQPKASFDQEPADTSWAVFITDRTREGVDRLVAAQAAYGSLYSDEINALVGRVADHPWNEFLIASKSRMERARQLGKEDQERLLCATAPNMRRGYEALSESYWHLLRDLEAHIGRRHCDLRKRLATTDAPPLFLRSVSGRIYIPDPEATEPAMMKICDDLAGPPRTRNKK